MNRDSLSHNGHLPMPTFLQAFLREVAPTPILGRAWPMNFRLLSRMGALPSLRYCRVRCRRFATVTMSRTERSERTLGAGLAAPLALSLYCHLMICAVASLLSDGTAVQPDGCAHCAARHGVVADGGDDADARRLPGRADRGFQICDAESSHTHTHTHTHTLESPVTGRPSRRRRGPPARA
jgi:hypothetical protein